MEAGGALWGPGHERTGGEKLRKVAAGWSFLEMGHKSTQVRAVPLFALPCNERP